MLALLAEVPELRVTHASGRGRGVDVGAARAQGTLLLVTTADVASATLDGVGEACRRVLAGENDGEVALGRYTVAHRVRALVAFRGARLVGAAMHRRLSKRLAVRNLAIKVVPPGRRSALGRQPAPRIRARLSAIGRPSQVGR